MRFDKKPTSEAILQAIADPIVRDQIILLNQKEEGRTCSLFIEGESWIYQDVSLVPLFGTDKVPTAYPSTASGGYVIAKIKELNPEADIQHVCFGCIATTPLSFNYTEYPNVV